MSSDDNKPAQRFNSTKPKRPEPLLNQDIVNSLLESKAEGGGSQAAQNYHVREIKIKPPKLPSISEGQSPIRSILNKSPSRSIIKAVFNAYNPEGLREEIKQEIKKKSGKKKIKT